LLNYDNDFHDKDIHFNAFGGFVYRLRSNESLMTGTTGGLNFPDWYSLNNMAGIPSSNNLYEIRGYSRGNDVLYSALGSATLSWRNELFLEFQAREDWNSTLPPENNKYFYPGASITWNYTDRFIIPGMNRGQVRFAWADVGNGTNQYFANHQYALNYISGTGVQAVSVTPDDRILPGALGPERKREFEIGINNSFLKGNRLSFDMDFYTYNRYGQIISLPVSTASSSTGLLINAADVKQWGFEFSVTGTPVLTKDFRWDITVTGSTMGSRVKGLYGTLKNYTWGGLINGPATSIRADVGHPVGEIRTADFTRDDQGNMLVNNNGVYSVDNTKFITKGNIMPKMYGGVLSDLHYRNFNFRIGLDYKYGGTIFSYTNQRLTGVGQLASTLQYRDQQHGGLAYYIDASGMKVATTHDAAAPAGSVDGHVYHDGVILPGTKLDAGSGKYVKNDIIASASDYYGIYANDLATSFPPDRLYRNDYVKVREASISYTLYPSFAQRMHFQAMTITVAGRNLFYLYKTIPNIDVESATGADGYVENTVFPGQRTYSLGLNFAF
jgi:iron complex outermembrane receptor protein